MKWIRRYYDEESKAKELYEKWKEEGWALTNIYGWNLKYCVERIDIKEQNGIEIRVKDCWHSKDGASLVGNVTTSKLISEWKDQELAIVIFGENDTLQGIIQKTHLPPGYYHDLETRKRYLISPDAPNQRYPYEEPFKHVGWTPRKYLKADTVEFLLGYRWRGVTLKNLFIFIGSIIPSQVIAIAPYVDWDKMYENKGGLS